MFHFNKHQSQENLEAKFGQDAPTFEQSVAPANGAEELLTVQAAVESKLWDAPQEVSPQHDIGQSLVQTEFQVDESSVDHNELVGSGR